MVRRHLGLALSEARRLPWFEYESLIEGLAEEFGGEEGESSTSNGSGSLEDLGASGITAREVT